VEDRLDGSSNLSSWNSRLHINIEESDLLILIEGTLLPTTNIDEEKDDWKTNDVKEKISIHSVRDHLLPHISTLKTTYLMYDAFNKMFEREKNNKALTFKRNNTNKALTFKRNNTNKALTLKHQLQNL
jgi:hypothetical protein